MKNVSGKILNALLIIVVVALALIGIIFITGWVSDITTMIILIAVDLLIAALLVRAITKKPPESTVSKSMPGEPGKRPPRGRRGFMRTFRLFLVVVLIAALAFIGYIYQDEIKSALNRSQVEDKVEITDIEVMETLVAKSDLVTYAFEFDNTTEIKNSRQIFGVDVPFTTNTVTIKYAGVIKVGYDVSAMKITVDNDNNKIYVTLPEAKITDKYLYEDKLEYSEKNNIFNPISPDKISECLEDILNTELKRAEEQGIYDKAEDNVKDIITGILSVYEDYLVVYK